MEIKKLIVIKIDYVYSILLFLITTINSIIYTTIVMTMETTMDMPMETTMDMTMDMPMEMPIETTMENPPYIHLLNSYANQISALLNTTGTDTMFVVKRIFHIINKFLRIFTINTKEKEKKFISIITSITYAPPWDREDVIFDHLHKLCAFLSHSFPYNKELESAIMEDLQNISILDEITQLLELSF